MKKNIQKMIRKTYKIYSLQEATYPLVEKVLFEITSEEIP